MLKKYAVLLCVAGFSVALTSCTKLRTEPPQMVDFQETIPLEYGTLVAVTSIADSENGAVLWFEKPDQTIMAVRINLALGKIGTTTTIIRK